MDYNIQGMPCGFTRYPKKKPFLLLFFEYSYPERRRRTRTSISYHPRYHHTKFHPSKSVELRTYLQMHRISTNYLYHCRLNQTHCTVNFRLPALIETIIRATILHLTLLAVHNYQGDSN